MPDMVPKDEQVGFQEYFPPTIQDQDSGREEDRFGILGMPRYKTEFG